MSRSIGFILIAILLLFPAPGAAVEKGRAYFDFGVFDYEDGDYQKAVENFKTALSKNPDTPLYEYYLGKSYFKLKDYPNAEKYLNKAYRTDPEIVGLRYDLAMLYFYRSDFQKSSTLFKNVSQEEPKNVLAKYYAGVSLYKLQDYTASINYFTAASDQSPNIKDNSYYYIGMCHIQLGQIQKAKNKFEYIKANTLSDELRQKAERILAKISQKQEAAKPYKLYFQIGGFYDDNVRLEPEDVNYYDDEDDMALLGFFSGSYDFIRKDAFKIGAGYIHFQSWYTDLDDYNLTGSVFQLYANWYADPFIFRFSYLPGFYWLESENYLTRHQLKPEVIWKINKNFLTRLSYSYYDDDYSEIDCESFRIIDRTEETHEFYLDAFYSLMDKKARIFGGVGYKDNSASLSDRYFAEWSAKVGVSMKIPWRLEVELAAEYRDRTYDNWNPYYKVEQDDAKYIGTFSVSRSLYYEWLDIIADFIYIKNDSNINDYEYERKIVILSLSTSF